MKKVCASKLDCNVDVIQNDELVYVTMRLNNINFWRRVGKNGSPNLISWSIKSVGTEC